MGRPASFDSEETLDKIMRLFWREGFERTSMAMIEKETGLKRQSLYNVFGDKEAMYDRAIGRYREQFDQEMSRAFDKDGIVEAVVALVEAQSAILRDPQNPGGCMLTGGLQERGADTTVAADNIRAAHRQTFENLVAKVRETELPESLEPESIAAAILALSRGMAVIARTAEGREISEKAGRGMADLLIAALHPQ